MDFRKFYFPQSIYLNDIELHHLTINHESFNSTKSCLTTL